VHGSFVLRRISILNDFQISADGEIGLIGAQELIL